ncbi:hypothetical protein LOAG_11059 [Loa loa]|uniref:Uncharacterized protein n=1 Tax=Loa loa TaxID=7209 RepID=A0A1I7W0D2_LOALO|nr:hypothetical protein LOAG_11059 [Loa loa]EFO17439.2 hypothetical protein LOAG_11059 [Loa loa]
MPTFSEYFVHNAIPPPATSSLFSSSKNGFGHYRRFNSNVAYAQCYNPLCGGGDLQQHPTLFADHFAGTLIPMSNIWPFCHHCSMNLKRSSWQQPAATQHWPADTTFFALPGTSAYVAKPRLDIQCDTSPFPSDISSSSTANTDYADSTSSGIGSHDNYYQQEESGYLPGHIAVASSHVAVASSSDSSSSSPPQIIFLGDSDPENLRHNAAGTSSLADFCDYDFASAVKQKPQLQQVPKYSLQSTGLLPQVSSDVSLRSYQACYPSAIKLCTLRKRYLAKKGKGLSTANLRFGTGARSESIITPAANCFRVYQFPNHFLPLRIETYIHCLERYVIHEF